MTKPRAASRSPAERHSLYKAFVASLTGTSLEWYDFAVYSSCAALIFGRLFFQGDDPLTGTLQAFATYAVGYLSRPLGGIVFGRLGDVIGRKRVLVVTLLVVGGATVLIGLLPTYGQVGFVAPSLLVLLRFTQGVGVGGEWGGAVLLSSEFSQVGERGFWASAAQVGPPCGTLLANAVLAVLAATLSEPDFLAWGWRIAFLMSAVLIGFGLWIRGRLEETPVFREIDARGDRSTAPVTEVFRTHGRGLLSAVLVRVGPDVLYALFAVFVLTYATRKLGITRGQAVGAVLAGSAVQLVLIPLAGWLSDRFGRRRIYAIGAVMGGVWSLAFFRLVTDWPTLLVGVVGGLIFHSLMYGPQAAFIAEQFHARLRYTGSSLGYTLAGIFGGAAAPFAFTWILATLGQPYLIGVYVAVACGITLVGLSLGNAIVDDVDEVTMAPAALPSWGADPDCRSAAPHGSAAG